MANGQRKNWNRAETILAFDLYCKIPFNRISYTNIEVIKLSQLIGRTPGAVSLKMFNLAHCDPQLKEKGVSGMSHSSKLDAIIFDEFHQNLEDLAYETRRIKEDMGCKDDLESIDGLEELPAGKDVERLIKTRLGQASFRSSILSTYHNKCCITGIEIPALLIASHIKPWSESDAKTERTNPQNGLCLNAFHDKAFDRGLITVDQNYKVRVSSMLIDAKMDDTTRRWLANYEGETIYLPERFLPKKEFLEYHNDVIFHP